MLHAEIHGHAAPEVQGNEDYLTSEVFGHLRYLPPSVFWDDFLSCARGLAENSAEQTLTAYLAGKVGVRVSDYSTLRVQFWPRHRLHGVPDLALCFEGPGLSAFVLLIEAKLWADKSGIDGDDQLVRYLRILDDLTALDLGIPTEGSTPWCAALLYLTPRESLAEIRESVGLWLENRVTCDRLYRAQWQDIIVAARMPHRPGSGLSNMILSDVSAFLIGRNLTYFDGFDRPSIPILTELDGAFYQQSSRFGGFLRMPLPAMGSHAGRFYEHQGSFQGFRQDASLEVFVPRRAGWTQ
jgi:hypothetical protein